MADSLRILHLEDDPVDAELIQATLELEGLACDIFRVQARADYLAALRRGGFNVILADYVLPAYDGASALRAAREVCADVPFIFVTGALGEETAISTLKSGAIDYVLKTHLHRLVPAIRRSLHEAHERAERKRAEEQLRTRLEQMQAIYQLAEAVGRADALEAICAEALRGIQQTLGTERASILLVESDGVMRFKTWRGLSANYRKATEGHSPWPLTATDPQPLLISDVEADSGLHNLRSTILAEDIRALGFFPLVYQQRLLGKFMVYYEAAHQFSDGEVQLAQTVARHLAFAIERARLYAAEQQARANAERAAQDAASAAQDAASAAHDAARTAARISRLQAVTAALSEAVTPASVVEVILNQGIAALDANAGAIMLLSADGQVLEIARTVGMPETVIEPYRHMAISSPVPSAQVVRTGEPVWVRSLQDFTQRYPQAAGARALVGHQSVAYLPLTLEGRKLGSIAINFAEPHDFSQEDQDFLLTLARQCAQALERARLYEEARRLNAELEQRVSERTAELEQSREQLRQLSRHLEAAREEERTRIAREVHDELGGALTGLKMDVVRMQKTADDLSPDRWRANLTRVSELIDSTIQTVRRIATDLRPGVLDDLGLLAAIEWQLQEFQERAGIQCRLTTPADNLALDPESSTAVFRVFQETLTNVARHAQATRVEVSLHTNNNHLILEVRDNGRGISERDVFEAKSLGLMGMRERVRLLMGDLDIRGKAGAGTTVRVRIPLGRGGTNLHAV